MAATNLPPGRALHALLIGGSGFLGGHAARGLLAAGHHVSVLSRGRSTPVPGTVALTADRRDAGSMGAALGGLRFDLSVDFGLFDAPDLEWLGQVSPTALGRFVMISTGQVYLVGAGAAMPYREEDDRFPLMSEPPAGSADHAPWSYGAGKRRAEATLARVAESGLDAVTLRLPTVQGEGDTSLRLWAYLERMLDGGPLVLPDGARRPARFVYAGDLAGALASIAAAPRLAHRAYNLSQPDVMPLRDFIDRVAHAAGLAPRLIEASWEECRTAAIDERFLPYAGSWASVLDPARIAEELGVVCARCEDYLPRVVRWHLEHRPAASHEGYADRSRERDLAARLLGTGQAPGHVPRH